ncbi:ABC transporter ATP-binding protein [uncultured Microbacterium sp.]|uniref:ABC transporter ATP-binding protein n=1 Tax=uncultured Microbacterium sp. TaxID=191216 RepID=UPI0025EA4B6B|nr:ATP-binding cassette domain-containing protein [uncultured Microbacterium sp.]
MTPILEASSLTVHYGRARRGARPALDAVDLAVAAGESVGIVGESGSGKSTLAKALIGLVPVSSGEILLDGTPVARRRTRQQVRGLQMVFQDPSASLNPRLAVGPMLEELIRFHRLAAGAGVKARARQLLDRVGLPASAYHALPRRLSGGQRQRVGIARALAVDPAILIADESTAALDVSVQAAILNLLMELKRDLGLTLLFISHDLAVVRHISERVVVMKNGVLIEDRPAEELFAAPEQEYTRQLLAAVPRL